MMLSPLLRGIVAGLLVAMLIGTARAQEEEAARSEPAAGEPTPAGSAAESPSARDPVSADRVARWIAELDSDRYEVRELASQKLLEHGRTAVEQLAEAADGSSPEVAARAIAVLEELSVRDEDPELQVEVLERLAGLENRASVSRRAHDRLAGVWEQISLPIVLEMGARLDPDSTYFDGSGQEQMGRIILGPDWTGGDEGLVHVGRLRFLYAVSIRNAAVSTEGLEHLSDMPSLRILELYGMGLDDEAQRELRRQFPYVTLDIRHGAMLGVRGSTQTPAAAIHSVEPDSAAEKAGLEAGDIITKVNDTKIASFAELTAEIAKFHPGDSAMLEVLRDDELIKRKVVFGQWE